MFIFCLRLLMYIFPSLTGDLFISPMISYIVPGGNHGLIGDGSGSLSYYIVLSAYEPHCLPYTMYFWVGRDQALKYVILVGMCEANYYGC